MLSKPNKSHFRTLQYKWTKWGPDSVKAVQSYSIYRENMKQWNNNKERTELIEYSLDSWRIYLIMHP